MGYGELATRVLIERRALSGSGDSTSLQRVAIVYIDGREYRVYAPSRAVGDALGWHPHFSVSLLASDGYETPIENALSILAVKEVQAELEGTHSSNSNASADLTGPYYHVCLRTSELPTIEVKFDLTRSWLGERVLEPYQNLRPIILGGRTISIQDLRRVEIYQSSRPSSQFSSDARYLLQQGRREWLQTEPGVKDVTDELIQTPSLQVLPQKTDAIELLCLRFHLVARQLRDRHSNRTTLDVTDEYDVQDLLHALLRIFFADVRKEEGTPSFAGKSSRMDFLLPAEQSVIEAKRSRPSLGARELGSELIDDIARYKNHPSCKRLICFVYDPEGYIANPRGIEQDLGRSEGGLEVKVIIAPLD